MDDLRPRRDGNMWLEELPFDCIVCVCEYLSPRDLCRFASVCKVQEIYSISQKAEVILFLLTLIHSPSFSMKLLQWLTYGGISNDF